MAADMHSEDPSEATARREAPRDRDSASQASRRRRRMSQFAVPESLEHHPDHELVVPADDGVLLHVEIDEPTGPEPASGPVTVVLCHGFTMRLETFAPQRRPLTEAGYRVVAWDQRSHGRSERSSAANCTIDQLGADLRAVLDAVADEGDLVLIGHSMGGMTMMSFAEQHPQVIRDRVLAAAFIGTSAGGTMMVSLGFGPFIGRAIERFGPGALGRLGRGQSWLNSLRRFGRDVEDVFVERYCFGSPVSKELVRFTGDMAFSTPFAVMSEFLPSIEVHDKRQALAHFTGVEVLVVNGAKDIITPPDHSAEIVRRIPGAEHLVVRDAGHVISLEHPDLVTAQLQLMIERGLRARAEGVDIASQPHVRRTVTDLARRRALAAGRTATKARAATVTGARSAGRVTKRGARRAGEVVGKANRSARPRRGSGATSADSTDTP